MRPSMRPLLPAVPRPLRSWWKQERQEAPRAPRQRRLLLVLLVLSGLLIALLARHLGRELLVVALLLAGLLVGRIILMLDRRRQLLLQARQERRAAGRIRQTSRDLDAMLQQLGMQPDSFERGEIKFKVSQLTSRMEWLLQSARSLALLDALTQLPNRRHFIEQVQIELARAKRGRNG
jgi:predicted signal transduction protein with EAL and GGDEF domain